jgi:hypothetical protein
MKSGLTTITSVGPEFNELGLSDEGAGRTVTP